MTLLFLNPSQFRAKVFDRSSAIGGRRRFAFNMLDGSPPEEKCLCNFPAACDLPLVDDLLSADHENAIVQIDAGTDMVWNDL